MTKIICHLALLAILAGCSAPKPPAWTQNPGTLYPPETYLTGVAFDRSHNDAENQARLEIARRFQVDLYARVNRFEIHSGSKVGALAAAEFRQEAHAELTATTDQALSGVRIAETWIHPKSGDCYALAILDRPAAARPLRGELDDIDLALSEQVRLAEEASSPARRLGHFLAALAALERRQGRAAALAVLEPSGGVAGPPHVVGSVAAGADRAAAQLRIGIELAGDRDDIVKGALVRTLAGVGMKLAPDYDRNLTIQGRVQTRNFATGALRQWTVASAQVDLLEGEVLLDNLRTTVREGSRQEEPSDTLARGSLGTRLASLLVSAIGNLDRGR